VTPKLSILIVARNEEARLPDCLASASFADEVVVVLDRTTDGSAALARAAGALVLEGAWELEGDRRNVGIAACSGDWILELDARTKLGSQRSIYPNSARKPISQQNNNIFKRRGNCRTFRLF
jgi:cellulose synthase/poly-beta-1,6-N-acetylglucosamine synthase-like glycosyltransferase